MSITIGDRKLSSSEYAYLVGLGTKGDANNVTGSIFSRTAPMTYDIPEVGVYATRPTKPIVPESVIPAKPQGTYTPSGDGRWTYYSGGDTWVDNVTHQTMLPDVYEKKFPNQLRQSDYRTSYK